MQDIYEREEKGADAQTITHYVSGSTIIHNDDT
jgi:hypothetical protein